MSEHTSFGFAHSSPYQFLDRVGEGAMGEVHLVAEQRLLRQVALKTLRPTYMKDPIALGRFLNEVQITAQLDHPNIVPIYCLDALNNSLAYTMKLVSGRTLKAIFLAARQQWRQKGGCETSLDLNARLAIFLKVCEAIHYAHSRGVIHRDLKPSNLMVGDYGEVYVMDWGIARVMGQAGQSESETSVLEVSVDLSQEDVDLTQSGQILGTPRYMSPEQIKGQNNHLDGRSDLFALGAILYETVTLKTAFRGDSPVQLLKRILTGQIEPWSGVHPRQPLPVELQAIAYKAMAQKREARYPNVNAMREDILRYLQGEPIMARPDNALQKIARQLNRHRHWVLLGVMLFILFSAGVSLGLYYVQHLERQAAHQRETQITALMERVAQRSRAMNMHFMRIENWTYELASLARYRLLQGQALSMPVYLSQHFNPPDAQLSQRYGEQTSTEWPIVVPAWGTVGQPYLADIQKLQSLRPYFKRLLLRSDGKEHVLETQQQRELIQNSHLPVMWATVVLTRSDTAFWYPGKDLTAAAYQKQFSPTHRPYYLIAAHQQGVQWGEPYVDGTSDNVLFPSALALYSPQQQLLGTVSLDTQPEQFLQTQMHFDQGSSVQRVFLSNAQGEIIVQGERTPTGDFKNRAVKTKVELPQRAVREALKKPETGYLIKGDSLWIYYYLPTPRWFYVVEADLNHLLKGSEGASE